MESEHWLWRLDATAWLRSAQAELRLAEIHRGSRRKATTHCRRAAGMALNAVLVVQRARGWDTARCETAWGRSYVDHLRGVSAPDPDLGALGGESARVADAARELLRIAPDAPSGLITLGVRAPAGVSEATSAARTIVTACARMLGDEPAPPEPGGSA